MGNRLFARLSLLALLLVTVAPQARTVVRAQAAATFQGTLSIVWGDPRFPGVAGAVGYFIETADGQHLPVQVSPAVNPNDLLRLQGRAVIVTGRSAAVRTTAQATAQAGIVADTIVADPRAPQAEAQQDATVSGTKRVI